MRGQVMTVLGPVEPDRVGWTLMHEHLFIDISDTIVPPEEEELKQYEYAKVDISFLWLLRRRPFSLCRDNCVLSDEETAIRELEPFVRAGGATVVDCTVAGIGSDPRAVSRVARATGLNIVQGTGAHVELRHPPWVASESARRP